MESVRQGPTGAARTWGWVSLAAGGLILLAGLYLAWSEPRPEPVPPAPAVLALDPLPWANVLGIEQASSGTAVAADCSVTPCLLMLPPGEYRIRLEHPTYGARTATVLLAAGQRTEYREPVSESYDPGRLGGGEP